MESGGVAGQKFDNDQRGSGKLFLPVELFFAIKVGGLSVDIPKKSD